MPIEVELFLQTFNLTVLIQAVFNIFTKYTNAMSHREYPNWDAMLRNPSQERFYVGVTQNYFDIAIDALFKRAKLLEIVQEYIAKCGLSANDGCQNPDGPTHYQLNMSSDAAIFDEKTRIVEYVVQSLSERFGENVPAEDILAILNEIILQICDLGCINDIAGLTSPSRFSPAFDPLLDINDGPPQELPWGTDDASQLYYADN